MYYTGFADEAAVDLAGQIAATKELGWHFIESRNVDNVPIHDLDEAAFDRVAAQLQESGVAVNCIGSAVANWACDPFSEADFEKSRAQLGRALKRMSRLNCKMLRGMSFRAQWMRPACDPEVEENVFRKVKFLVRMCEDAGVLYCHENCNNYGGMSYRHTLKLLEKVNSPNLKLVFDTGNPVMNYDRSQGDELGPMQSAWEFYRNVRDFVVYVHIKDGHCTGRNPEGGFHPMEFTFAGEGDGDVRRIVRDLLVRDYDGGFSMEPHMKLVLHDKNASAEAAAAERRANYVEYGRRFMRLVEEERSALRREMGTGIQG